MRKTILTFILFLTLSSSVYAEIKSKNFLQQIFNGCSHENNEKSADYDILVQMIGVGGVFEYCGCFVNIISKQMNVAEMMKLGMEAMKVDDYKSGDVSDGALSVLMQNQKFSDGVVQCMTKVVN